MAKVLEDSEADCGVADCSAVETVVSVTAPTADVVPVDFGDCKEVVNGDGVLSGEGGAVDMDEISGSGDEVSVAADGPIRGLLLCRLPEVIDGGGGGVACTSAPPKGSGLELCSISWLSVEI